MRFNLRATQKPATIQADASGKTKLATFEMVAYNGGPMVPEGWANPVICDLAGFKINSQNRPILRQHDSNKIVGHSTRISVGPGQPLKISGVISGVGPDAQEVVALSKNGFQWQASIGADPSRSEFIQAGDSIEVNGQTVNGPITVSWETELGEISFVPLGADQTTSATIAARRKSMEAAGFDESSHPRADDGKFGQGGSGGTKKPGGGKGKKKEQAKEEPERRLTDDEADEVMQISNSIRRDNPDLDRDAAYEQAKDEFKKRKSKRDTPGGSANSNRKGSAMNSWAHQALRAMQRGIRRRIAAGKYATHEPMKFSDEEIDKMSSKEAQGTLKKCLKAEEDAGDEGMSAADDDSDDIPDDKEKEIEEEDKEEERVAASRGRRIQASRKTEANEERRVQAIRAAVRKHGVETIDVDGEPVSLSAHAIERGWSVDKTELTALRAGRAGEVSVVPGGHAYSTSQPKINSAVLECAVLQAARHEMKLEDNDFYLDAQTGQRKVPEYKQRQIQAEFKGRYTDQVQQAAHTLFKGGAGLQSIVIAAARQHGYRGSDRITDGNLEDVLRFGHGGHAIRAAEGASTASIANILANVQNKFALMGYLYVEQAWREIAAIRPTTDFKPTKSINLLGDTMVKPVPDNGQLQDASLSDQPFANQVDQYGRMLTIGRKPLINDDLSILTTTPTKMGQGAGLGLNNLFWTVFQNLSSALADDGAAFWANTTNLANGKHTTSAPAFQVAGNANLLPTGASSVLSSASLQVAKAMFDNQVDPNGNPMGFDSATPILLFPPELWITAMELVDPAAIGLVYGGASAAKQPNVNMWKGRLKPVMSRYLNKTLTATIAGSPTTVTGSTTAWYNLYAPVAGSSVIEVAFLNGVDTPQVLTAGPDWNFDRLGISMRVVFDFGVNQQNYRAGIKSNGA